jgi:thiamine biosynthesis lipoprotein
MGTRIDLWLQADQPTAAIAFAQVEELFRDVEQALSRFNPSSDLSRLNAQPETWVAVSKTLWNVLALSLEYADLTDGQFDPTLLHALRAAGYTESFDRMDVKEVKQAPSVGQIQGWRSIRLDEASRRVWLPQGIGLDFGGIAKGYAAQWAARLLGLWGPCLVDAGGDLVAGDEPSGMAGWPVKILAPRVDGQEAQRALVSLTVANQALATSGVDHRRWLVDGKPAHHIIDPRTGVPAVTDALTVSVIAPHGAEAEVWAKVAILRGTRGLDRLDQAGVPVLVIDGDHTLHINETMSRHIDQVDTQIILHTGQMII